MKQIGFILQVQPQQPVPFPGVAPWALGIFPSLMWLKLLKAFATAGASIRELRHIPHGVIPTSLLEDSSAACKKTSGNETHIRSASAR
jgi:hypothetical protein